MRFLVVVGAVLLSPWVWSSEVDGATESVESVLLNTQQMPGFIPLHWDSEEGRLYADISDIEGPFIYYNGLSHGLGSNDLGLDRGRLGDTFLVEFRKVGKKVFLAALNTKYTARSEDAQERRAVAEAFAESIIWGFAVVESSPDSLVIDLTDFALSDAMGIADLLAARDEGSFKIDESRSAIYTPKTKSFPDNTEIDATLTLVGKSKGRILGTVAPNADAITVHGHHSFIRLPDDGYQPLPYDARAGYIHSGEATLVYDYASPIDAPIKSAFARRHRLEKVDPTADMSGAVEPIIYWVDSGAPEPVKSALIEGALWWNQAFEAAGYKDAFQVKVLPSEADPMDIRYNVIQWVHRSTRGWSYGSSIRDPRTEEILKGHVTLGSLRVRQDYLIAEGLIAPYDENGDSVGQLSEFALARIRQLSAHEVGHTLGIAHNFSASADGRASVMDYPHPLVTLNDEGEVVLSDAYDVGIGDWDKRAVIWGYQDFPDEVSDAAGRAEIIAETLASGLSFVADEHARIGSRGSSGPAHPKGSLWDNGADPVAELNRMMQLRAAVLNDFSERTIQSGRPMASLEDVLVPAFLMHRYQVQAVATVLGGQSFTYAMRGDGQVPNERVAATDQRAALSAMLATLEPSVLNIPERVTSLIPPRPPQSGASRELFPRHTGYVFDPMAAASTAALITLDQLTDHKRAARLNNQHRVDTSLPSFGEVLTILIDDRWPETKDPELLSIERAVQLLLVDRLADLLANAQAATQVRADALDALSKIKRRAERARVKDPASGAHMKYLANRVAAIIENPEAYTAGDLAVPPGSPI
ncbi:hypothetical protein OMB55_00014370 [gamma proteobacterium HIMB55]|nr:hypothetical protein OMB55_00014370 [gamma proteobacterium HIMB55]